MEATGTIRDFIENVLYRTYGIFACYIFRQHISNYEARDEYYHICEILPLIYRLDIYPYRFSQTPMEYFYRVAWRDRDSPYCCLRCLNCRKILKKT